MKKSQENSVSSAVMQQIQKGSVSMRPRWYFLLLSALSVVGIVLTGLIFSYFLSVLFLWVRIETSDTMAWGARANLSEVLGSFPWWALPLAIVSFALTVWLVQRHGAMYRHKTTNIIALIAILSLVAGVGLSYLGVGGIHPGTQRDETVRQQRGNDSPGPNR